MLVFFCDHLNGNSEMRFLEVSLFFNRIGIILPQNKDIKDIKLDSVLRIQPVFQKFVAKKLKIVNLAFDF